MKLRGAATPPCQVSKCRKDAHPDYIDLTIPEFYCEQHGKDAVGMYVAKVQKALHMYGDGKAAPWE